MPSRRKRKRLRLAEATASSPEMLKGKGGKLRGDWSDATVEDCAMVREAIREGWPTKQGTAIIGQLTANLNSGRPQAAIRVGRLLLHIDKQRMREERRAKREAKEGSNDALSTSLP